MAEFAATALAWVRSPAPDLTLRQICLLTHLATVEFGQVRAMAEHLRVSKPVITRAANTLEYHRLLRREPEPRDKRQVRLVLTDRGRALLTELGILQ